jgi:hypothetical protein
MAEFFKTLFGAKAAWRDPHDVRSTFLYVEPSFLTGAGRIFDIWGGFDLYSISRDGQEADLRALYADWRVIGQDFRDVVASEAQALTA